jgi:coenzyme F420-0:L-glutamate ligase/coenzyme F420-1:gamma-L-glutamate ligase
MQNRNKAAKQRKNAAHARPGRSRRGASRGLPRTQVVAPEGRKKPPQSSEIRLIPIPVKEKIESGNNIARILLTALRRNRDHLQPGDILVVKHKIVSKAEGQFIDLATVNPTSESVAWATQFDLDPRVIELALRESKSIIRRYNGVLITETKHGFLCANSGIDISNVDGGKHALLLPEDPDRSAQMIRREIKKQTGITVAVIITDSFGRPWREGLTDFAIGIAGLRPMRDDRGKDDPHGYKLKVSVEAIVDELACAAGLVCGKLNRTPACIVRGFCYESGSGRIQDLLRSPATDLFR